MFARIVTVLSRDSNGGTRIPFKDFVEGGTPQPPYLNLPDPAKKPLNPEPHKASLLALNPKHQTLQLINHQPFTFWGHIPYATRIPITVHEPKALLGFVGSSLKSMKPQNPKKQPEKRLEETLNTPKGSRNKNLKNIHVKQAVNKNLEKKKLRKHQARAARTSASWVSCTKGTNP